MKNKKENMNSIHFTLQGKGGVGKSLVSALLAQYYTDNGADVKSIDTDPVNQTLVNYKALKAQHIELLDGSKINERNFDKLMERLLSEDGVFIVDNGASSFVPLSNYLIENDAIKMLKDSGRNVFIHSVITGSQALLDTLSGFNALAAHATEKNIVVWLNQYFGAIESDGKTFLDMKAYKDNQDKVCGIVEIAKRNQDTFGKDVEQMVTSKLTFSEAIKSPEFSLMAKQRIKTVQADIYNQLEEIGALNG